MNPFFIWLIKSSVSLSLLYAVFKLVVSRNKMHTANRFVLLSILLSSVVLPFADVPVFRETTVVPQFEVIHEFIATPQEISIVPTQNEITETFVETTMPLSAINWWLVFYLAVIGLLVIRLVFSMVRVLQIIRRAEKQNFRDVILAIVKDFIQPFSFLQHIILSEKDFAENRDIVLAHEYAHIQYKHSVDLIICELFTALFWFNPFMWLLRRELKLIHEYQADEAVLNKGIDAKTYQLLVLKKAVGERRFALANNFTQKPILKRIKMMTKNKSKKIGALKMFLFVPVIALLLMAFSKPGENGMTNTKVMNNDSKSADAVQPSKEYPGFYVEVRTDGYYIDKTTCKLEEVVSKARAFQKTGREDILLVLDKSLSLQQIDKVREALRDAKVYHVNQTTVGSDEIIYPAGDVTRLATLADGKWEDWMKKQLQPYLKDIPENMEYRIFYGFTIDKNGKVSGGHVISGDNAKINEAYNKVLSNIPDWIPAEKGKNVIGVYYTEMSSRKNYKRVVNQ